MNRENRIAAALRAGLTPTFLEIVDESEHHAGHAGARPGGETHYRIRATAAIFAGKSRVERHRMINDLLKSEFESGLHALAVHAKADGE